MTRPNHAEIGAALNTIRAVADVIKELSPTPAGPLYAAMMGAVDFPTFDRIIGLLTRSGLVTRKGDLLIWTDA